VPLVQQAHQQGAVRPVKGPNTWGKQYFWPLHTKEACCGPQAPKARKIFGSGFCFPGINSPRRVSFQILVLRFPYFFHVPTQNPQDLEKSTNNSQRAIAQYPCCVSSSRSSSLETHPHSCGTYHRPLLPQEQVGFRHGSSTLRIDFRLRRQPEEFVGLTAAYYTVWHCGLTYCVCYPTDT